MKPYCVYRHITPAGKSYIGISVDCERRWARGEGYRDNAHFYRAIKKYGWDSIEHVILASGLTLDEAKHAEMYNIQKYQSTDPEHGYNHTLGGDTRTTKKNKAVICITDNIVYESIVEASMDSGVSESAIIACCKGKSKSAGHKRWAYMPYKMSKIAISIKNNNGETKTIEMNEF